MATAIERFLERAADLGLHPEIQTYPEGTRTAADAAAAIGCDVAQIVKSLVFVADDGRPVLVLTSGANRVDEARVAAALGATELRKATADEVRAATGYAIGGTPPFGHDESLLTVVDPHLLDHAEVWAAAGTPTSVFPLTPADLVRLTGARTVEVAA